MEAPAVRYPTVGRLLASPQFVWLVVAIAVLIGLASLGNGLLADDLVHHRSLRLSDRAKVTRPGGTCS